MAKVKKGAKMSPTAKPSTAPAVTPTREQAATVTTPAQAETPVKAGPSAAIATQSGQTPTADQIARRAYELYQQRGGRPGRDFEDWIQAERELRSGARH